MIALSSGRFARFLLFHCHPERERRIPSVCRNAPFYAWDSSARCSSERQEVRQPERQAMALFGHAYVSFTRRKRFSQPQTAINESTCLHSMRRGAILERKAPAVWPGLEAVKKHSFLTASEGDAFSISLFCIGSTIPRGRKAIFFPASWP